MEMAVEFGVGEQVWVMLAQVFAGAHEEAAGVGGWIAQDFGGGGRGELDHEADDVARGAELAVLPGGGEFAEHVLVDVALGVAVVHGEFVGEVDDFGQEPGRGDGEAGVAHIVGLSGAVAEGAQEGEDVLGETLEHVFGCVVLERFQR